MRILAIDTALTRCSAALTAGNDVLAVASEPMRRGHAERLGGMVAELMRDADYAALDRIAVTTGPGSFTGMRVGLAFARGLALSLGRPCVGLSTLQILALEDGEQGWRAAAIESGGDVCVAAYRDGRLALAPVRLPADAARDALARAAAGETGSVRGPAAARLAGGAWRVQEIDAPRPEALAMLAAVREPAPNPPTPLYLRPADAIPQPAT